MHHRRLHLVLVTACVSHPLSAVAEGNFVMELECSDGVLQRPPCTLSSSMLSYVSYLT